MLFAGLGSVRIVKNCHLGHKNAAFRLENAALGLRPLAAFSRPLPQFFTTQTFQQANNIYIFYITFLSTFETILSYSAFSCSAFSFFRRATSSGLWSKYNITLILKKLSQYSLQQFLD